MEKKKNIFNYFCFFALAIALLVISLFEFMPNSNLLAFGDSQITAEKSFGDTTISMSSNSRIGGNLNLNVEDAELSNGTNIQYYVFNWSELYRLNFSFSFPTTTTAYTFGVSYIRSTNLSDGVFDAIQPTILFNLENFEVNKQEETFSYSLNYGIDANSTNNTIAYGNGYGLYKFSVGVNNANDVISFYVAVKPSPIPENVNPEIAYYIQTSTSLLTAYQFMVTNNAYNYVESTKIHWHVVGESKDGIRYVLTYSDWKDMDQPENYNYLWETIQQSGQQFFFDSNGIEGNWTVYCTIDGTEIKSNSVEVVTSKKWLTPKIIYISIASFAGIVLIILAITIFMQKRHEKVW